MDGQVNEKRKEGRSSEGRLVRARARMTARGPENERK